MSGIGKIYAHYPQLWENAKINFLDRKLKTVFLDDGIIIPPSKYSFAKFSGGVYDKNKKFVAGLVRKDARHPSGWELNNSPWPDDVQLKQSKETVVFGGVAATHFGHFLLDGLTRMWSCIQNEENKSRRIAYLLLPLWSRYEWLWEFFSLLGIPRERILVVTEPTQFNRIVVPEESAHSLLSSYTRQYCLPFQFMVKQAGPPAFLKKVYLAKSHKSRIRGEDYFLRFYQERGFVPVRPETLSVKDQIRLLSGAEEVVCTLGTLSHLAMFCKPGTKFTMLAHTDELLQAQAFINKASGVRWIIIDVSQNIFFVTHWRGISLIGPNQYWKEYVKEEWGEKIEPSLNKDDCYEYLKDLCECYEAFPKRFVADVERNNAYAVFSRIFHVVLGREMDKALFEYEKYRENQLKKRALDKKYRNLLDALNKEIGHPVIEADVHLSSVGWLADQYDKVLGDRVHPIEALRIRFPEETLSIGYATYTKMNGWSKEAANGEMTGSVGKSLQLSGIYMRLEEPKDCLYSICYRVLGIDGLWSKWARDGEKIFNREGMPMVGIEIRISTN